MRVRDVLFLLLGVAVVALAGNLARVAPSPGALAAVHAARPELQGPEGCKRCHAAGGRIKACTGCHEAIANQLASGAGWHGALVAKGAQDCDQCHAEHWGADFPLVSERSWGGKPAAECAHQHVDFRLAGAHAQLDCVLCHVDRLAMAPATRTYLGLTQECASCHDDPHGEVMIDDCAACHAQQSFKPAAKFAHAQHFQLLGGHARVGCAECHPAALDFAKVRGTTCEQCHATPHRELPTDRCDACHKVADDTFATATPRFTPADHARLGFQLTPPHSDRECRACHDPERPYAGRFSGRRAEDCVACHESPHGGQFGPRESRCVECHSTHFKPSTITVAAHQPELRERHQELACEECHFPPTQSAPARFVATPATCGECHVDPHGGQFEPRGQGCAACHDERAFTPSHFDMATRHPPLVGAHVKATCGGCHKAAAPDAPVRYLATPQACAACHTDPHAGQFCSQPGGCAECHNEQRFVPSTFSASRHQPPLAGAHLAVACNDCHRARADGTRIWAGTPRDCRSCHADPHAGQLTRAGNDCNQCHRSDERWLPVTFDHQRDSRFALDGVHAQVACVKCHRSVPQADGREVIHYAPLGVECRDCHTAR